MLSKLNTTAMLRLNMRLSAVVSTEARDFGAKKKKVKRTSEEPSDYETIDESVQAQPVEPVEPVVPVEPVAEVVSNSNEPWKIQTQTVDLD